MTKSNENIAFLNLICFSLYWNIIWILFNRASRKPYVLIWDHWQFFYGDRIAAVVIIDPGYLHHRNSFGVYFRVVWWISWLLWSTAGSLTSCSIPNHISNKKVPLRTALYIVWCLGCRCRFFRRSLRILEVLVPCSREIRTACHLTDSLWFRLLNRSRSAWPTWSHLHYRWDLPWYFLTWDLGV